MEKTLSSVLEEQYRNTLDSVALAEAGSQKAEWELKKLDELHRHMVDERSAEAKQNDASDEKKDKLWKRAIDIASIVIPVLSSGYWMAKALKFEETGTFTSRAAQWVSTHLKRNK